MSAIQARLLQLSQDGRTDQILELLADPNTPPLEFVDEHGYSPLMYAAQQEGQADTVEALLTGEKRRADINYQSPKDGSTALMVAAFYGSLDAIDTLIHLGADVTLKNHAGQTVLDFKETHSESASDARAVQHAIYSAQAAVANPRPPSDEGDAAGVENSSKNPEADRMLQDAAKEGKLENAQAALDLDANVDSLDVNGLTPLMLASKGGHLELVKFLVEEGAADRDFQSERSNNNTALMFAVRHGQVDCVEWLIAQGGCAVEGLTNGDGEAADTLQPVEKVTFKQMAEVIRRAIATAIDQEVKAQAEEEPEPAAAEDEEPQPSDEIEPEPEAEESAEPESTTAREELEEPTPESEAPTPREASRPISSPPSERAPVKEVEEEKYPEPAAAPVESAPSSYQPPQRQHAFHPTDASAFLELPLHQALQLVVARYQDICKDFDQSPSQYIISAVTNVAFSGQALLLNGNNPTAIREDKNSRLDDRVLYPLLEVLSYGFNNVPITTIDLSFNHLSSTSAQGLAVFITNSHTLTSLDLTGNDFTRKAGELFAESLEKNRSLTKLSLHTNPIGPYAIAKFAAVLGSGANTTLTELNLGNTECETLSLMKLATALQTNRTLKRLNIDSPLLFSYQEETTIHLARSLALNTSLVSLSMKGHRLSDDGARWLSEYLLPNQSLTDFNLSRNHLTTTGVAAFVKTIAFRRVECLITLDGNNLTGQTFEEINEAMSEVKAQRARNAIVWMSKQDRHSLRAKAPL